MCHQSAKYQTVYALLRLVHLWAAKNISLLTLARSVMNLEMSFGKMGDGDVRLARTDAQPVVRRGVGKRPHPRLSCKSGHKHNHCLKMPSTLGDLCLRAVYGVVKYHSRRILPCQYLVFHPFFGECCSPTP